MDSAGKVTFSKDDIRKNLIKYTHQAFQLIPKLDRPKILDIGCGTGEFSVFFNSNNYTGIDIEPSYINYAQKNYPGKFVLGDATRLPFNEKSFDKILIAGVLHHLNDNDCHKILNQAKKDLSDNGKILIMEDVDYPDINFLSKKM